MPSRAQVERAAAALAELRSRHHGFEFVSGVAAGASAMPAKWSRRVFSFRFYEGKISRAFGRDPAKFGIEGWLRMHSPAPQYWAAA
jgi:hypothetical protein